MTVLTIFTYIVRLAALSTRLAYAYSWADGDNQIEHIMQTKHSVVSLQGINKPRSACWSAWTINRLRAAEHLASYQSLTSRYTFELNWQSVDYLGPFILRCEGYDDVKRWRSVSFSTFQDKFVSHRSTSSLANCPVCEVIVSLLFGKFRWHSLKLNDFEWGPLSRNVLLNQYNFNIQLSISRRYIGLPGALMFSCDHCRIG